METLKNLLIKLELVDSMSNSPHKLATINKIGSKIWITKGMLEHGFEESALKAVVEKQARANRIPQGYLYPDLLQVYQMSASLQQVLENKARARGGDQD